MKRARAGTHWCALFVLDQGYEREIDLPNYTQPEKGQKYILFLKKVEPKNIFTPASVPFQIEIDQTNQSTAIAMILKLLIRLEVKH